MKKLTLFICLLLTISNISFAQFPKTFPEDGLDVNVGISYNFYNNESQADRREFMKKFTALAIGQGFNVVDVAEFPGEMTEVEKFEYKKKNDSLHVKYVLAPIQHSMFNFVMIRRTSDDKSKRYSENHAFQAALDLFIKDLDKFKASHPEANKVPYEDYIDLNDYSFNPLEEEKKEEQNLEPVFINKVTYVNELPSDLANETLLFLIFNDFDVSPEDSALISADELIRRKKKIAKYRKMNAKFKESFIEYPYSVKFVYAKDLKDLVKVHPYELVDNYWKVERERTSSSRKYIVVVHNYCIVDHRKSGIYYRLPAWEDCDKEIENACLKNVAKSLAKMESK